MAPSYKDTVPLFPTFPRDIFHEWRILQLSSLCSPRRLVPPAAFLSGAATASHLLHRLSCWHVFKLFVSRTVPIGLPHRRMPHSSWQHTGIWTNLCNFSPFWWLTSHSGVHYVLQCKITLKIVFFLNCGRGDCVTEDAVDTRPGTLTETGSTTSSDEVSVGSGSVLFQPGKDGCVITPPSQALGAQGSLTLALWIKPSSSEEMWVLYSQFLITFEVHS